LELVLSPQRCFQQRCDVETPPSPIRRTESSFHPETTPRGWGRCQRFTATPPRRDTTPEGAVVAGTDRSQAGLSSEMLRIEPPSPKAAQACQGTTAAPCRGCRRRAIHLHRHTARLHQANSRGPSGPDRAHKAQIWPDLHARAPTAGRASAGIAPQHPAAAPSPQGRREMPLTEHHLLTNCRPSRARSRRRTSTRSRRDTGGGRRRRSSQRCGRWPPAPAWRSSLLTTELGSREAVDPRRPLHGRRPA
jgi:hypothetical protein